ncbi:uncharacterized protein LOC132285281 [Cornus florida]|uniref:uncharacterized protein LOC132285281 n=1 Tax=Cornus florida TaxID=4283 RepID=UPI00289CFD46|nr:uncharacterized protein LOC132285281 [Cornus florida]
MSAAQVMKRIPRIKFPQRHPKTSVGGDFIANENTITRFYFTLFSVCATATSIPSFHIWALFNPKTNEDSTSKPQAASMTGDAHQTSSKPQAASMTGDAHQTSFSRSAQTNMTLGGKASLQPNRRPVSEEEIEAILMGGCF